MANTSTNRFGGTALRSRLTVFRVSRKDVVLIHSCFLLAIGVPVGDVFAQRAHENVVAEASDAFGTAVGREQIGLYSPKDARGFSPSDAGNLRIDGLYFDQVAELGNHIMSGSSVHVGISAQGFPFPAPTGVVDFHLRTPGDETAGSVLVGYQSYGDHAYSELGFQVPVIDDQLSIGGGVGYSRNSSYNIAALTDDWSAGVIARWRPIPSLVVTPFWSAMKHSEEGERSHVFIGSDGFPEYRSVDLMYQPWASYGFTSRNYGGMARYFAGGWEIAAGIFRSQRKNPLNYDPLLLTVDRHGHGDYSISAVPPHSDRSTSGEIRVSKTFSTETTESALHLSVKGRDRRSESGGADVVALGPATTRFVPRVRPDFNTGPTATVTARQFTPGLAYELAWAGIGQLTIGLQRSYYDRTICAPGAVPITGSSAPWLYNLAAAAYLSQELVAYASFTRGFEEIGTAPINAVNKGEVVPAQITEQIDAGIRYRFHPELQLVAGVFEITKPYFDLDEAGLFRRVGNTTNRGVELSIAGDLTHQLTVVAGAILIDPSVQYDLDGTGPTSAVAIGPAPGLFRANFQYRSRAVAGLTFDAEIETLSSRYARFDTVLLPPVTTIDLGVRYDTRILGRDMTIRFQVTNLTNEFGLNPSASGKIGPFDERSFDFSLAVDI